MLLLPLPVLTSLLTLLYASLLLPRHPTLLPLMLLLLLLAPQTALLLALLAAVAALLELACGDSCAVCGCCCSGSAAAAAAAPGSRASCTAFSFSPDAYGNIVLLKMYRPGMSSCSRVRPLSVAPCPSPSLT
jgi:hypothetical protein